MAKKLLDIEHEDLLETLQQRFEKHIERHPHTSWQDVLAKLKTTPTALSALFAMEQSGGEPDIVEGMTDDPIQITFVDCAAQIPKPRVSLCYDEQAREARAKNKPRSSVIAEVTAMGAGVCLLNESQYVRLQNMVEVDTKTSCWIHTDADVRSQGGAIFADKRFGRVFFYHNGADSYYSSRGFRVMFVL